jgi:glycosyltransferase involved in cell wall biosynthesis
MKSTLPSISIIIATYNSSETLDECLQSIVGQHYPKHLLEILLADGGSTDTTFAIGKKYNARLVHVNGKKQGAEYNRATGARLAKHEILLFVDHDNVLPHKLWLRRMVMPFIDDATMVGVETLHYAYDTSDSLIGRYFSLFGVNDIFAYYVGKADRMAYFYESPASYGVFRKAKVENKGEYFSVDFAPGYVPTLGSNGFMIRKKLLFAHAKTKPHEFFHIDINVDLINKGFTRYAFIKDVLHHKTDERGIVDYLRRRLLFMRKYHFADAGYRRYSLYESKDVWATVRFIFYSVTIVVPFIDSLRGYIRIQDPAWFLNPLMCISLVILYGFAIIQRRIKLYANNFLEK